MAVALAAEPNGGGQLQQIAATFGVDWPHLLAQAASFAIVCALLYWFAYGPVLRMLEERRTQIAGGLAHAAQIQARLADIDAQRLGILQAAQTEGARVIEEARGVGRRVREQETARAEAAAEEIVRRARAAAAHERAGMLAEARREVGELVVKT